MCAICDGATYEEVWAHMMGQIAARGFYIQYVEGEDARNPAFAYTVGLSLLDHPEFIVFSMCPDCAVAALEPIVAAVQAGRRFDEGDDPGDLYPFDEPAELLRFPDSSTHLFRANDLFRLPGAPPVPALQLLWPGQIELLRCGRSAPATAARATRSSGTAVLEKPPATATARRNAIRRRKPAKRRRRRPRSR